MNHKYLRISVLMGSIMTFGFGAWHIVVPRLYGWFDYLPSVPYELTNGIIATNFFLSLSLILFGAMAAITAIWQWQNLPAVKLVLWIMSILWVLRVGYQLVKPQGSMIPGLSLILLAIFAFIALCFLIPAVILQMSAGKTIIMLNLENNIMKKLFIILVLAAFLSVSAVAAGTKIIYPSPEKAKQELQMLLPQYETDQKDAKLLQQLGLCYHSIGETGDADAVVRSIEFLEKASKLKPADNEIKAWLGSATSMRTRDVIFWEKMNYSNKGVTLMDAAISAEPDNISIRIIRGNNYLYAPSFLGKDGTAVNDLEFVAAKLQGTGDKELLQEIYHKLGLAYKKVNNTNKAKENFKLAIELLPNADIAHKIAKEEHL